jgi:hypothetical protein
MISRRLSLQTVKSLLIDRVVVTDFVDASDQRLSQDANLHCPILAIESLNFNRSFEKKSVTIHEAKIVENARHHLLYGVPQRLLLASGVCSHLVGVLVGLVGSRMRSVARGNTFLWYVVLPQQDDKLVLLHPPSQKPSENPDLRKLR